MNFFFSISIQYLTHLRLKVNMNLFYCRIVNYPKLLLVTSLIISL